LGGFGLPFLITPRFPKGLEMDTPEEHGTLVDINEPDYVEVQIDWAGKVIWVHVDGITRLRACRIKNPIIISDERKK